LHSFLRSYWHCFLHCFFFAPLLGLLSDRTWGTRPLSSCSTTRKSGTWFPFWAWTCGSPTKVKRSSIRLFLFWRFYGCFWISKSSRLQ
jgi:hypothetical protein